MHINVMTGIKIICQQEMDTLVQIMFSIISMDTPTFIDSNFAGMILDSGNGHYYCYGVNYIQGVNSM